MLLRRTEEEGGGRRHDRGRLSTSVRVQNSTSSPSLQYCFIRLCLQQGVQNRAGGNIPEMNFAASIMAPATPFGFYAMQKYLTIVRTRRSMVCAIMLSGRKCP